MHDLKWLRDNADAFDRGLRRRGLAPASADILSLDRDWRAAQTKAEQLQAERNQLNKQIGAAKAKGGDASEFLNRVAESKDAQAALETQAGAKRAEIDAVLAALPNLPADDVPEGADETANRLVRSVGTPPAFDFPPEDHVALGEALHGMDFARAGKLSGARFAILSGALARLHRALGQFMLDLHTGEFGYTEINPPLLVRDETAFGTGQLPKFSDDLFRTTNGLWLIPTAEVPLTNLVAGEIIEEAKLPLRFTAWTPCFRSEAGAAGKDTRGMIRQHQFEKVELVSIVHPDRAAEEHERMTACAEEVLKRLGLAYRVMLLCAGDMGFAARKTYDIEVWLPGQSAYREISSCSDCGEFQARRMNGRFRPREGKGVRFVATLNGSGLAIGRTLIAVLENYQNQDGTIEVPAVLRRYIGGDVIGAGNRGMPFDFATKKLSLLSELRRAGIGDERVLKAVESVPRELFVPHTFQDRAYENIPLPIGRAQTISQPFIVALMTEMLQLEDKHRVLEIGTGSGYQAAVLSRLCRRVFTLERHQALYREANQRFAALRIHNITSRYGDGTKGWPESAPYDRIIVTAAAAELPLRLIGQLREGGVMIAPVGPERRDQSLIRIHRHSEGHNIEELGGVRFVPLVRGLPRDGIYENRQ